MARVLYYFNQMTTVNSISNPIVLTLEEIDFYFFSEFYLNGIEFINNKLSVNFYHNLLLKFLEEHGDEYFNIFLIIPYLLYKQDKTLHNNYTNSIKNVKNDLSIFVLYIILEECHMHNKDLNITEITEISFKHLTQIMKNLLKNYLLSNLNTKTSKNFLEGK